MRYFIKIYLLLSIMNFLFSQQIQCWGDDSEGQINPPEENFIMLSNEDFLN